MNYVIAIMVFFILVTLTIIPAFTLMLLNCIGYITTFFFTVCKVPDWLVYNMSYCITFEGLGLFAWVLYASNMLYNPVSALTYNIVSCLKN